MKAPKARADRAPQVFASRCQNLIVCLLLLRLQELGPVILSGDIVRFHENYKHGGVPGFNHDRVQTLASIRHIK